MTNTRFSILTAVLAIFVLVLNTTAQDYVQWDLPTDAKARLGKGHINEIAYAPDGNRLVVATSIGIWIYDAQTGEELDLLTWGTDSVSSLAYSPDGRTIVSDGGWGRLHLWDANTGQHIAILEGRADYIAPIAYSPDGTTIASGVSNAVHLWDANTGQHIAILEGHTDPVASLAYSPDGRTIASASGGFGEEADNTVRLWDVNTGQLKAILIGHKSPLTSVAYSPDGRTIASASGGFGEEADNTVRLWDANTGQNITTLTGHEDRVNSIAYSPDGTTIAIGSYGIIYLWDSISNQYKTPLTGLENVVSLAYSPDGRTLASGSTGWDDNPLRFWDANTGELKHSPTGHITHFESVVYSPDGTTIAVANGAGIYRVHLWDANTGRHKGSLRGFSKPAFSPDSATIAIAWWNGTIYTWDVGTRELIGAFEGHTRSVDSIVYSPDGTTLASGSHDNTVRLWDVATRQLIATLTGHDNQVTSVAYSPDGTTLASGSHDNTVRLWDVATRQRKATLTGHENSVTSVAYSPDGTTIASGSWDDTIRLWDANTGQHITTLEGHTRGVYSIAYSPDGMTLASGSGDQTILWDAMSGEHKTTFDGHTWNVTSVAYSPDGCTLATSSGDSTVILWDLTPYININAIVNLSPSPVQSPPIGEQLRFTLNITGGKTVMGYQATVQFDPTALRYVESSNSDYLPAGSSFVPPVVKGNSVTLAATSLAEGGTGDGALATLTFEVVGIKASTLTLSQVRLIASDGARSIPRFENAEIIEPPLRIKGDVNGDGIVNIQDLVLVASRFGKIGENDADVNGDNIVDIVDLVLVAGALGNTAGAPTIHSEMLEMLTTADVRQWLVEAQRVALTNPTYQRGIHVLAYILAMLTPKETALLSNYPNPFNPETWIPYQLAKPANVTLRIHSMNGTLIRTLELGYQTAGVYLSRNRAAYWDGKNILGERVASGIYFYTLIAGDFTATRKMLIRK